MRLLKRAALTFVSAFLTLTAQAQSGPLVDQEGLAVRLLSFRSLVGSRDGSIGDAADPGQGGLQIERSSCPLSDGGPPGVEPVSGGDLRDCRAAVERNTGRVLGSGFLVTTGSGPCEILEADVLLDASLLYEGSFLGVGFFLSGPTEPGGWPGDRGAFVPLNRLQLKYDHRRNGFSWLEYTFALQGMCGSAEAGLAAQTNRRFAVKPYAVFEDLQAVRYRVWEQVPTDHAIFPGRSDPSSSLDYRSRYLGRAPN